MTEGTADIVTLAHSALRPKAYGRRADGSGKTEGNATDRNNFRSVSGDDTRLLIAFIVAF